MLMTSRVANGFEASPEMKWVSLELDNTFSQLTNKLATREVIDLCYSDHQFSYIHPDLPSGLTGNWKISHDDAGVPILFLAAVDGTQKEFALSLKEGKTFLNDTRFIRSFNNELTPYCLR